MGNVFNIYTGQGSVMNSCQHGNEPIGHDKTRISGSTALYELFKQTKFYTESL